MRTLCEAGFEQEAVFQGQVQRDQERLDVHVFAKQG